MTLRKALVGTFYCLCTGYNITVQNTAQLKVGRCLGMIKMGENIKPICQVTRTLFKSTLEYKLKPEESCVYFLETLRSFVCKCICHYNKDLT
jgi:hypothetical protein